jgi:hypothetical protein
VGVTSTPAGGLFTQLLDLLVHGITHGRAGDAADARADDATGAAADQAAEQQAAQRACARADRGARHLLLAGIGIGDAGRQADQRRRTGWKRPPD